MGEAQRRKARGEYPERTSVKRDRRWLPNVRKPGAWFGKRDRNGVISFPDGTRYLATTVDRKGMSIPGPWRRLVLTGNGWKVRTRETLSGRQKVRARKVARRAAKAT
jgi:hypothetical protein